MKISWIIIPATILLLSACTAVTPRMNIDPQLDKNSYSYNLKIDTLFFNNMYEFSFGEYKVENITSLLKTSASETQVDQAWYNFFLFGDKQEIVNSKMSSHHSYTFSTSNNIIWNANCILKTELNEEHIKSITISGDFSSLYVCNYTRPNGERWYLFIKENDSQNRVITLSNNINKTEYFAKANSGEYVKADGSIAAHAYEFPFGYTWSAGNNNIAAVSLYDKKPKIWLSKKNEQSVNSILSMASVGLILYEFKKDADMNPNEQM